MFIFQKGLQLTLVSTDFINTHSLPSMHVLQNTSVITMLAFIVSPETKFDHDVLWQIKAKLQALRPSEEFIYNLPIANQLYELSFKAVSADECIGRLRRWDKPLSLSTKNEKVGGLLTSLILSSSPSLENCENRTIVAAPDTLRMKEQPPIPLQKHNDGLPRILVVDDSDVNREVVNIFLEPDFPTPIFAKNGLEALDALQREPLDLILMDIHMPEMNGVEATLAIRKANEPWSNIIIIALTADTAYQHSRVYKNIGMDDAINKPVRQDVLIKTILRNWKVAKLNREAYSEMLEYAS